MASRNEVRPVKGPSRLAAQASQAADKQNASDALLQAAYEKGNYNYKAAVNAAENKKPWEADQMAYLAKMRRNGLTQPFGALLVVEPPLRHTPKLHIVAYSENAAEMLGLSKEEVAFGKNACTFFTDSTGMLLHRETLAKGGSQQLLVLRLKNKPIDFYAIINKSEEGILIDLEPVIPLDPTLSVAGSSTMRIANEENPTALSLNEARQAVLPIMQRLQNMPSGSVLSLCEALAQEVRDLLQYDRVMVYKFHPDQHGEVVAESVRDDMEPYLGLHYPSTDLPQAIRILLMRVGHRIISDAARPMVKLIQPEDEDRGVDLSDSNLRAPHGCHVQYMLHMGSMSSFTVAIPTNDRKNDLDPHESTKKKKLWGLVVGHHIKGRHTPYPVRKAIEVLAQHMGHLVNRETVLHANLREENILDMQKKLCDMLEADIPLGIVKDSPSILDLVKCDGAVLYFAGRFWKLGVTPTERQIADIAEWILKSHGKKSALCTDSLTEAGYPKAAELGSKTCGMVAIKIGEGDFVMWFREHTAKEVKWGGRKEQKGEVDDDSMVPRNSFKAFMEIVKKRSVPWEDIELEAINGLRLMLKEVLEMGKDISVAKLEGGTSLEGSALSTTTEFKIQASGSVPLATLTEEVEVLLKCYKSSFLVTDATVEDYPVLFCSEAFTVLTGYTPDEVVGGTSCKLDGPETDDAEVTKYLQALDKGTHYTGKHLHYKKDGGAFWDMVTVAPVKDTQDRVLHHVVVFQELAKYAEGQVPHTQGKPVLPALAPLGTEKGFPVSLIRYDGRFRERSTRKAMDIVHAIRSPGRAKLEGPLTPGREGGIMEELKVTMTAEAEQAADAGDAMDLAERKARKASTDTPKVSVRPARRRSVVDLILGKGKEEPAVRPRRAAFSVEMPPVSSLDDLGGEDGKKRRAAKGMDFGTTLERIEFSFIVTDPRLDENPIIFMSDEYIKLTGFHREEHIGGDLIFLDGEDSSPNDIREIRRAVQATKELSIQFQAYKRDGSSFWALFHLSMVKDTEGTVLYIINVVKNLGNSPVSEDRLKRLIAKAEKEASSVAQALRDLPNAAAEEKQWTIHSRAVHPKPHKVEDPLWAAIKKVRAEEGRLGLKHFKPLKPLGNGDSGAVMLVELRGTGKLFAVKVMEKESMIERNKVHRVAAEREILEQLDHPFLPTLYASFQTAKHVCFVTDFCAGGELYDFLEVQPDHRFEEHVAKHYAAEILISLEYLHCQGVVYRDLKPENILLTNGGHIVLTDFDLSVVSSTFPKVLKDTGKRKSKKPSKEPLPTFVAEPLTRSNSFVGTEEYIAPEIVTGSGHTSAIDWWSYGILLYEMLYGYTPFCGNSMRKTFSNILNKDVDFEPDVLVSEQAKSLILALLHKNPDERLGSKNGAADIKSHPFFRGVQWPLMRMGSAVSPQVPIQLDSTKATTEGVVDDSSLDTWRLQEMGQSGSSNRTSGSYAQDSIGSSPQGFEGSSWNESILQS